MCCGVILYMFQSTIMCKRPIILHTWLQYLVLYKGDVSNSIHKEDIDSNNADFQLEQEWSLSDGYQTQESVSILERQSLTAEGVKSLPVQNNAPALTEIVENKRTYTH